MSSDSGGLRPGLATVFSVVGFGALAICGLGVLSLVTGADVVAVRGLGALPGAAAFAAAVVALTAVLVTGLRRPHPSYTLAAFAAVAVVLAYLLGLTVGAVAVGVDAARAVAAAGAFALSWFAVVVAACGAVAGWTGVALVRTRARPPQWRWEQDEDR